MEEWGVEIKGLKETVEMMEGLPNYLVARGFSKALHAAGNVLLNQIQKDTPVQLGFEGGDLVVQGGDLKGAIRKEVFIDNNLKGGYVTIDFGRLSYVAKLVEYGHKMIGHKPGKKQLFGPKTMDGNVKANPFMRTAADKAANAAIEAFSKSIYDTVVEAQDLVARKTA